MRIAIVGKGGSGKTTLSALLIESFLDAGERVWAIDGDTDPNLGLKLGIPTDELARLAPIPGGILEEGVDGEGKRKWRLSAAPRDIVERHGVPTPLGAQLLVMGRIDHGGGGCACGAHARVRYFLGGMLASADAVTIVDMEAGLEHFGRGTSKDVDVLLVVLEPYFKALETARRCIELAGELGVTRAFGVANKLRDDDDARLVRDYAAGHGIEVLAEIPFDPTVAEADAVGRRLPIDPEAEIARRIAELTRTLITTVT